MNGDAPRNLEAVWLVRAGLFVTPLLMIGFALRFDMPIADALFVSGLLATLPMLALAQSLMTTELQVDRLAAYISSASTILVIASIALVLGALGPGLGALGLGSTDPAVAGLMFLLVGFGATSLTVGFEVASDRFGWRETRVLEQLVPRSSDEKRMFVVLSFVAGFGEEIAYRGYLLAVLVPLMPSPWLAALVSSLAFGLLHAYQGGMGIARTGLLGFLFCGSVIVGGALWPAIACHVLIDIIGGLWLGPRILRKGA